MQRLPIKQRVAKVVPFLQRAKLVSDPPPCDTAPYVTRILEAAGDRIKVAGDILDFDDFFVADAALKYDEAGAGQARASRLGAGIAAKVPRRARAVEPFTAERLEQLLHAFVEAHGIKAADIVHAIRVAVTGKAVGFGLFDTLAILGRERSLARIDRALTSVAS